MDIIVFLVLTAIVVIPLFFSTERSQRNRARLRGHQ